MFEDTRLAGIILMHLSVNGPMAMQQLEKNVHKMDDVYTGKIVRLVAQQLLSSGKIEISEDALLYVKR